MSSRSPVPVVNARADITAAGPAALGFFDVKGVTVPAAVSVFHREMYQAPRSWVERAYPNLIYFNEVDAGNHFGAWQEPDLFTNEVRAGLRSLREGSSS